jgi:hypothetical protein
MKLTHVQRIPACQIRSQTLSSELDERERFTQNHQNPNSLPKRAERRNRPVSSLSFDLGCPPNVYALAKTYQVPPANANNPTNPYI